jgi:hypothetical protein
MGDEEVDILHDGNQIILDLYAPLSTPARAL